MLRLALGLVFLTGMTGLIYQITWQKYLSIYFGSHALASALILAAFFFFLSLGYLVIGKYAGRLRTDKLLLYGIIEGGIGVIALVSPTLFHFLQTTLPTGHASPGADLGTSLLFATLFMGLPTFLMGGTIPVLTQGLSRNFDLSHRMHAIIYALNTLGAFVGTLLAGFYLLEQWGLPTTLFRVGLINIGIGFITFIMTKFQDQGFTGVQPDMTPAPAPWRAQNLTMFGISFLSGFYTFSLQSLIIRMAGLSIGSSTYTYSIVVGAFVLSIGVGSLVVAWLPNLSRFGVLLFTQIGLFVTAAALYVSVPLWPELFLRIRVLFLSVPFNFLPYWLSVFVATSFVLFIPVALLGMNLPLLFNLVRKRHEHLAQSVGRLYAVNCLGSTVGAIVGGYAVYHWLSGDQVFLLNLGLIAMTVLFLIGLFTQSPLRTPTLAFTLLVAAVTITTLPRWPNEAFTPGLFSTAEFNNSTSTFASAVQETRRNLERQKLVFHQFDPNTVVGVTEQNKDRTLYVNGKPDAGSNMDNHTRALAALTPLSISPRPVKEVFIVGLGAGLSAGIVSHFSEVEKVTVAEISQGVVQALPFFAPFNFKIEERPEKVEMIVSDAYKVLKSYGTDKKFDLVICEPSNPWVSGVEKLFTLEFYQKAKSHLAEDGLYSQWFPLFGMNDQTFLTILATFQKAFPYTAVWSARRTTLTLIGSQRPIQLDIERTKQRFETEKTIYTSFGLNHPFSALAHQMLPPFGVAALLSRAERLHSLENPVLEFAAGRSHFANQTVNLDLLLEEVLKVPVPPHFTSTRLLIDQVPAQEISEQVFLDLKKVSDGTPNFFRFRQALKHAELFPESSQLALSALERSIHRFLLDPDAPAPTDAIKPEVFARIVRHYRLLTVNFAKPIAEKILAILPTQCPDSTCSQNKLLFLALVGDQKDSSQLEKTWALGFDKPETRMALDEAATQSLQKFLEKRPPTRGS